MRDISWRRTGAIATLLFCGVLGPLDAAAQQSDDIEERLRAALRQTTMQLRDLEDQNATLLAKQSEAERDRLALTQKLAADEKELEGLRRESQSGRIALQQSAGAITKLQNAYKDVAGTAQTRDVDAKRLDGALVQLREQARLCEEKNARLYKLGQELLDLYDKKGILDVIKSDEPVTKLKRVEYENLMQEYDDKLHDNQIVRPTP